jgi:putative oxidoreductase
MRNHTKPFSTCIPRLVVGFIFLSEGLQKFITPEAVGAGRFAKIGFSHPEFWANFTGTFEIICGCFICFGVLITLAVIPLLIIMITAFIATKYPLLLEKGFWTFAHEYRTDFAMTMLLIWLLIINRGKRLWSFNVFNSKKGEHENN